MADKLYLLMLASGEDFFGEEKSDRCIEMLTERDWLEVIHNHNTFLIHFSHQNPIP